MLKSMLTITIVTGYLGSIEMASDTYVVRGEASWKKNNVEITELPIHVWTDDYEQSVLEDLKLDHGNTNANFNSRLIKNYTTYSTEKKVFFRVRMSSKRKIDLYKEFKLESTINTGRMNLFDHGCLKRYESVEEILQAFYTIRLKYYEQRKNYLEHMLLAEIEKLDNQVRLISEKRNNILILEKKESKDLIKELRSSGYVPDPVKVWRLSRDEKAVLEEIAENEDEEAKGKLFANRREDFTYLTHLSEGEEEVEKKRDAKMTEFSILRDKSPSALWKEDLAALINLLDAAEDQKNDREGSANDLQVAANLSKEKRRTAGHKSSVNSDGVPSKKAKTKGKYVLNIKN